MGILPDLLYENKVWKKGFKIVAGCDEVGRGCLAGPVVGGCVVFPSNFSLKDIPQNMRIDDSKKLSAKQREAASKWIKANCLTWGVGIGSVAEINRVGIVSATHSGFRRAVKTAQSKLNHRIQYLLVDAFYIPYVGGIRMPVKSTRKRNFKCENINFLKITANQLAIVKGDGKSISIAAASIIAKVYRDTLMQKLSGNKDYSKFLWHKNKGYGTREHIDALKISGPTKIHRKEFIKNIIQ